jgi:cyclase
MEKSAGPRLPQSRHFRLEMLASGVYAAIASDLGGAVSNAGIVDLGDRVLVFDTFLTPDAGRDLLRAAEQVTHRPVTFVINSHYHNDHIRGNQAFPEQVEIVATKETDCLIKTKGVEELAWDKENAPQRLAELEKQLEGQTNPHYRGTSPEEIAWTEHYFRVIAESLRSVHLRLPTQTFEKEIQFHSPLRTAYLISYGGGHTGSDAFLYLPEEKIAFAGDLLFVGCHPYLGDGDPLAWVQYLQELEALDLQTIVPGHGPVGQPLDLALVRQYIVELTRLAEKLVKAGATAEEVAAQPVPEAYNDWQFSSFFAANMRYLFGILT